LRFRRPERIPIISGFEDCQVESRRRARQGTAAVSALT
jgi:hypothetical protein